MSLQKEEKNRIIGEFKESDVDTGSMSVQVAILTHEIKMLTEHCVTFPKDFSCKLGLTKKVNRRRDYLKYVQRKSQSAYKELIGRLGLRK